MAKIACGTLLTACGFAAVWLTMSGQFAHAQSTARSAAAGQDLAQRFCAGCHVIVPSAKGGWTDAPGFVEIANRQDTTAAKLSGFIQKPHMHMLNTGRPLHEPDEISTYIMSLRKS